MIHLQKYVRCDVCEQRVDAAVPKSFCPFCSVSPGARSCPWTKPAAIATLGLFGAHVAGIPPDTECKPAYEACQFSIGKEGGDLEDKRPSGPLGRLTIEVSTSTAVSTVSSMSFPPKF